MRPAATEPAPPTRGRDSVRPLAGLMLAGYGALVLAGVLPHDSAWAGLASLAAGAAALAFGLPAVGAPRAQAVAGIGCACVGGVLGHALARRDGLGLAEAAIMAYGLLL